MVKSQRSYVISTDNFYRSTIHSVLPQITQKICHSTAETLIFITMQN